MSDFWNLSDGTRPEQTTTFDSNVSDPLPDNTDVLAVVEEAAWDDGFPEGAPEVIKIRWVVLAPGEYKNRKIFQKCAVKDIDSKKRDKAKRMLMAIDTNAGGKLAKLAREPEDQDLLVSLMNKPMILKLKVWEIDGKKGNWVAAVSPHKKPGGNPAPAPAPATQQEAPPPAPAAPVDSVMDDEIPF